MKGQPCHKLGPTIFLFQSLPSFSETVLFFSEVQQQRKKRGRRKNSAFPRGPWPSALERITQRACTHTHTQREHSHTHRSSEFLVKEALWAWGCGREDASSCLSALNNIGLHPSNHEWRDECSWKNREKKRKQKKNKAGQSGCYCYRGNSESSARTDIPCLAVGFHCSLSREKKTFSWDRLVHTPLPIMLTSERVCAPESLDDCSPTTSNHEGCMEIKHWPKIKKKVLGA